MEIDQKGLKQSKREVNSLKINRNGLNQIVKITEWSLKYRFMDECSQSFTSRYESIEYLARF